MNANLENKARGYSEFVKFYNEIVIKSILKLCKCQLHNVCFQKFGIEAFVNLKNKC